MQAQHTPNVDSNSNEQAASWSQQTQDSFQHLGVSRRGRVYLALPVLPSMTQKELCINCGLRHPGTASLNCFFITLRMSGRGPLQLQSTTDPELRIRRIPDSPADRERLLQGIWERFQEIKTENDRARLQLSAKKVSKGELKAKEPIPWLSWHAPTKHHGQTRNETSFRNVWQRHVEEAVMLHTGANPMFLSSTLLDTENSELEQRNVPPEHEISSSQKGNPDTGAVKAPPPNESTGGYRFRDSTDSGYASQIGKDELRYTQQEDEVQEECLTEHWYLNSGRR